jgi:C2 domain
MQFAPGDPYAVVTVPSYAGNASLSVGETSTQFKTWSPTWNEQFSLWVPKSAVAASGAAEITVRVVDNDYTDADDPLGSATLLIDTRACSDQTLSRSLSGPGGGGTVTLRIEVVPMNGAGAIS